MGFGFVVARFGLFLRELASVRGMPEARHTALSLWAGTALVLLGLAVNAGAAVQHVRPLRALRRGQAGRGQLPLGIVLAALLAAIGLATAACLGWMR